MWIKHKVMDVNDADEFETLERNFKKKKVAEIFDGKLVYERHFKPLTRQHSKYDEKKEQHICICGAIRTNKLCDGYSNLTFQHIYM